MRNWVVSCVVVALPLLAPASGAQHLDRLRPPVPGAPAGGEPVAPAAPLALPPRDLPVDRAALLATAERTAERLRSAGASWSVSARSLSDELEVTADVLHSPRGTRTVFRGRGTPGALFELARVLETPDAWYVTERGHGRKYRPYEADFEFPVVSWVRDCARPRLVGAADLKAFGREVRRSGSRVTFMAPAPFDDTLRSRLATLESVAATGIADAGARREIAEIRRTLTDGLPVTVDLSTGIIERYVTGAFAVTLSRFSFGEPGATGELDPGGLTWEDRTADLSAGRPEDVVFIERRSPHKPDDATSPLLLNVRTGQTRRLPFRGGRVMPGCFVKGHTAFVVPGYDSLTGLTSLHEIDLRTGACRPLGGDVPSYAPTEWPALAPDGRTIVAVRRSHRAGSGSGTTLLVDVGSGRVRPLVPWSDVGFPQWLPDGGGLLYLKYDADRPESLVRELRHLTVDGGSGPVGQLRCGGFVVLRERRAILYCEGDLARWYLCDLDGTNRRLFGDGFADHNLPSVSPDGTRLLMIAGRKISEVRPVIVDLATLRSTPVPVPPGGWAFSSWR
jgi:hypothetical protein